MLDTVYESYLQQDKLYLETYLRVRMMSVSTAQSFQTVSDFTAKSATAVKYVQQWTEICVKELGISHEAVENATLSPQLQASRDFYTTVARDDDWFAYVYAQFPLASSCILNNLDFLQDARRPASLCSRECELVAFALSVSLKRPSQGYYDLAEKILSSPNTQRSI